MELFFIKFYFIHRSYIEYLEKLHYITDIDWEISAHANILIHKKFIIGLGVYKRESAVLGLMIAILTNVR